MGVPTGPVLPDGRRVAAPMFTDANSIRRASPSSFAAAEANSAIRRASPSFADVNSALRRASPSFAEVNSTINRPFTDVNSPLRRSSSFAEVHRRGSPSFGDSNSGIRGDSPAFSDTSAPLQVDDGGSPMRRPSPDSNSRSSPPPLVETGGPPPLAVPPSFTNQYCAPPPSLRPPVTTGPGHGSFMPFNPVQWHYPVSSVYHNSLKRKLPESDHTGDDPQPENLSPMRPKNGINAPNYFFPSNFVVSPEKMPSHSSVYQPSGPFVPVPQRAPIPSPKWQPDVKSEPMNDSSVIPCEGIKSEEGDLSPKLVINEDLDDSKDGEEDGVNGKDGGDDGSKDGDTDVGKSVVDLSSPTVAPCDKPYKLKPKPAPIRVPKLLDDKPKLSPKFYIEELIKDDLTPLDLSASPRNRRERVFNFKDVPSMSDDGDSSKPSPLPYDVLCPPSPFSPTDFAQVSINEPLNTPHTTLNTPLPAHTSPFLPPGLVKNAPSLHFWSSYSPLGNSPRHPGGVHFTFPPISQFSPSPLTPLSPLKTPTKGVSVT